MCSQRVKKYAFSQLCLLTLKPGFHVIVAIILTQSGFWAIAIVRIEPACVAGL